ncbi:hypothetical protein SAMN05444920_108397 [Nonomuraea solani]|uniref:Uncharacterized protein n=1 Tax=Nonomuraea solani TaxID=1144553 RepID=A0A1H6E9V0_9ACTN|nr:hypothetical protein SAMN05444920_108397 [Nonomuraea solani]
MGPGDRCHRRARLAHRADRPSPPGPPQLRHLPGATSPRRHHPPPRHPPDDEGAHRPRLRSPAAAPGSRGDPRPVRPPGRRPGGPVAPPAQLVDPARHSQPRRPRSRLTQGELAPGHPRRGRPAQTHHPDPGRPGRRPLRLPRPGLGGVQGRGRVRRPGTPHLAGGPATRRRPPRRAPAKGLARDRRPPRRHPRPNRRPTGARGERLDRTRLAPSPGSHKTHPHPHPRRPPQIPPPLTHPPFAAPNGTEPQAHAVRFQPVRAPRCRLGGLVPFGPTPFGPTPARTDAGSGRRRLGPTPVRADTGSSPRYSGLRRPGSRGQDHAVRTTPVGLARPSAVHAQPVPSSAQPVPSPARAQPSPARALPSLYSPPALSARGSARSSQRSADGDR